MKARKFIRFLRNGLFLVLVASLMLILSCAGYTQQKERFQKYYAIQEKIAELSPTLWILEQAVKQAHRSDYVVFPAAEAVKQGKLCNPVMGLTFIIGISRLLLKRHSRHIRRSNYNVCSSVKFSKHIEIKQALN